jgi:hypothetical protein
VHAHVQRLVSVVRMATLFEKYNTEEQRSVVRFCGQKDSMQRIFIKKCFLFMLGSVCHVTETRNVANVSLMTKRLKRTCGSGSDNSQKTSLLRVSTRW